MTQGPAVRMNPHPGPWRIGRLAVRDILRRGTLSVTSDQDQGRTAIGRAGQTAGSFGQAAGDAAKAPHLSRPALSRSTLPPTAPCHSEEPDARETQRGEGSRAAERSRN